MKTLPSFALKTLSAVFFGALSLGTQAAVFQAENYNVFYDTTPGNSGGAYRNDAVDIQATSDAGGGHNVGWIDANEWLVYNNLTIPSTGNYTIRMRVASPNGGTSASVDLNGGAVVLGTANIPNTGGWQNWQTVSINANINAGTYNLGVFARTAGWNFNWIEVVPSNTSTSGVVRTYQHCDYGGWTANLPEGNHTTAALRSRGFVDNDASSLRVAAGYEAVLFQYDNFTGASTVVKGDEGCLVNRGFNDVVSSVIVRKTATTRTPTWSDEFNNINTGNWSFETGGGGWGNSELEYYTNGNNAYIQFDAQAGSNVLVLEARRENPANYNCWYGRCEYTSTRMVTRGKKSFKYGRMEARLKLPQTQGIWPAFWMLGDSFSSVGWPQGGEIDIMEHVGFEPNLTHGALHGPGYSGATPIAGTADLGQPVNSNYHIYAVEWDTNGIRWFVDGKQFYSITKSQVQQYGPWVYDQPFWFLLNVAVGGGWPGSPDGSSSFPQRMYVDYVRVYQ